MRNFVMVIAAVHIVASAFAFLVGLLKLLPPMGDTLTGIILIASSLTTAMVAGAIHAVMEVLPKEKK
jgi:hypothetical protein